MNLGKKKQLAAKVLNVGKNRIKFAGDKLPEIKEAITKQDIRDLYKEGFITIKSVRGRRKKKKRRTRRGPGKIKIKVNKRKQNYIKITRKLRNYLKELKNQKKISNENYWQLRKKIKMRYFRSKAYLKEYLGNIEEIKKDKIKTETKIEKKKQVKKKEKPTKIKTKGVKKV